MSGDIRVYFGCFLLHNSELFFWLITLLALFGIYTIFFLIFIVWRNRNKSAFVKIILSITLLILALGLVILELFNLYTTNYSPVATKRETYFFEQQKKQVKIPSYVIETANRLIINRVGNDIFQKDIILDNEETLEQNIPKMDINNTYSEYQIAYRFLPLKILNNNNLDTLFYVDVEDKNSPYYQQSIESKTGIVNNTLPNCVVDPKLCEFKLTATDAKEIANKNNFNSDDLKVKWNSWDYQKLLIEVTSCKLNKVMYINYTDGSVLSFKDKIICGKEGVDWFL